MCDLARTSVARTLIVERPLLIGIAMILRRPVFSLVYGSASAEWPNGGGGPVVIMRGMFRGLGERDNAIVAAALAVEEKDEGEAEGDWTRYPPPPGGGGGRRRECRIVRIGVLGVRMDGGVFRLNGSTV